MVISQSFVSYILSVYLFSSLQILFVIAYYNITLIFFKLFILGVDNNLNRKFEKSKNGETYFMSSEVVYYLVEREREREGGIYIYIYI